MCQKDNQIAPTKSPSKEALKSDMKFFGFMGVFSAVVFIICISAFSNGNISGELIIGFIVSILFFIISAGLFWDLLKDKN